MGWWGHGIYDGDGPQDAIYTIGQTVFGRKKFDQMLDADPDWSTENVLKANLPILKKNRKKILDALIRDTKSTFHYDGAASLIAGVAFLHKIGITQTNNIVRKRLCAAFEYEMDEADSFDSTSARRSALQRAKNLLGV